MNRLTVAVVPLCACGLCVADITSGFEPPVVQGSAAGTPVTNQDGWYVPVAGSVDYLALTYETNSLGIPANPTGGSQCLGGRSAADVTANAFARAQRDNDFSAGGSWIAAFDVAVGFNGVLPSAANLGSFSLQPSTTTTAWQTLYNWVDNTTAVEWNCAFLPYDATGVQVAQPGVLPDPAFGNLLPNHWYRLSVTWSFDTNSITSTSITDLSTGATTTANPVDWYLLGGATPTGIPLPSSVRFFAGGAGGNIVAVDNFTLVRNSAPPCDPDYNQDGNADQDDVRYIIDVVAGAPNPTGRDPDFNQDGNVDQDDVRAVVNVVAGAPCP